MWKFSSLKAEDVTANNATKQDSPLQLETSLRQKMDKILGSGDKTSYQDSLGFHERQEEVASFYSDRSETTWRQRLDFVWSLDEYGMPGPELQFAKTATEVSWFSGTCYGAYHESAKVQRIFHEQNKYTMFQHPREAQRALQERIVLAMIQGGWRSGWRMGLLTFTFTGVSQSLVAIRNYINPLDYAASGAVMGAVYKFNMGPKGMIGAGVAGSFLGLQAGILIWGVQKFSGETVAEKWSREYDQIKENKELKREKLEKKDKRNEIILIEEENRDNQPRKIQEKQYIVEETWEEEDDWVRTITIKVTGWLRSAGLLDRHSEDNFRISEPDIKVKVE
eukprot:GFUD01006009.1.p1 GENE.GFUD01006009.1~~GFUD01006009.1.p1  ORF type:complete len:336 (+),score=86.24 GFUD01006009.1:111-1118(+)